MSSRNIINFLPCAYAATALFMLSCCTWVDQKSQEDIAPLKTEMISHAIHYNNNKTTKLTREEANFLDQFVHTVSLDGVNSAVISMRDLSHVEIARAKIIQHYLLQQGLSGAVVQIEQSDNNGDSDIILTFEYTKLLKTHNCPDWSSNAEHNYENSNFSNFGCSYYNNLAAQVLDKSDLEKGHGHADIDADHDSAILQKYMSGSGAAASGSASSSPASASSSGSSAGASGSSR